MQIQEMKPKISTHNVTSDSRKIEVHVFEPPTTTNNEDSCEITGTIVTVHPWAALGGGEHNTIGIARYITAQSESKRKWRVITFKLRSGTAVWGILSNHGYEVQQIVDVSKWAMESYGPVVLLGSSAGAPMAGSAMQQLINLGSTENNKHFLHGYIAVGYTFGNFASLAFGRHFSSVVTTGGKKSICGTDSTASTTDVVKMPPKLFIMGEKDEFTSVSQLEQVVARMKSNCSPGRVDTHIVPDVGHFQLESPTYDPFVSKVIIEWLDSALVIDDTQKMK